VISIIISAAQEINRQFNVLSFLERMFTVIENEFSVARSLILIFTLLASCLLLNTFMPIITIRTPAVLYVLASLIMLLLGVIILWPISLIYN
jgi:hypothetical protein